MSSIVFRTLRNRVRKSTRGIPLSIEYIDQWISSLLTGKSGPDDLWEIATRIGSKGKKAEADMNTYSGHIWMVDPRLEDERTNTIYNNNRIIVLFRHGKNKRVSSVPCCQVVSAKKIRYYFTLPTQKSLNEDIPIAFITINCNIVFATVRTQKNKSDGSFAGHVTSPRKVKVV